MHWSRNAYEHLLLSNNVVNRVGTHPSGASVIPAKTPAAAAQGTLSLECWLERHPEALGRVLAQRRAAGQLTGRLPFLMKVGGCCAVQLTPAALLMQSNAVQLNAA